MIDRPTPSPTSAPSDELVELPDSVGELGSERLTRAKQRFQLQGRGLREHAARGVIINSIFDVGSAALGLVQRFAVAAFLTASQFGVWGLVLITLLTLSGLKQIGLSDKYVQQDEPDQEIAFQKAFTLELAYTLIFCVFLAAVLPLYALIYGRPEFLLPAWVLTLALVGTTLQTPLWIAYRQMRFARQRTLEAINPVVSTVVMVPLAAAGASYWSIVIGVLAGTFAAGAAAVATSPYRLAFRLDRGTLREYAGFSWPLLVASGSGLIVVQGTIMVGNYTVGLAGVGAIALASSLILFAQRADAIISRTIYPAICAVKDRTELLFETFVKSNRLALMWGLPFGVGMMLFAPDLVHFVLGQRWEPAVALLGWLGLLVGVRQLGFNWNLFFNAVGNTRPQAIAGLMSLIVFAVAIAPLMIVLGLDGYIIGMAIAVAAELAVRAYYLTRMFAGFNPLRHLIRAVAPSAPAAAAVLAARAAYGGGRTLELALGEFGLYVTVTVIATMAFERSLLREIVGYLREAPRAAPAPAEGGREVLAG
jgi:O-antigen/teichoic acid export membrane protein